MHKFVSIYNLSHSAASLRSKSNIDSWIFPEKAVGKLSSKGVERYWQIVGSDESEKRTIQRLKDFEEQVQRKGESWRLGCCRRRFPVKLFWATVKVRVCIWELGCQAIWFSPGNGGLADCPLKQ